MLAILFLVGTALLGAGCVRRLLRHWLDDIEQVLWGIVVGWIVAALGVYLAARWQHDLTPRLVLWATLVVLIITITLVVIELRRKVGWAHPLATYRERYTGLLIVLVLLAPAYWRLLSFQLFPQHDGAAYSGSAGNDLNFHAALISSFRYGQNFPARYPLLPPGPLFYPWMPDFHAAVATAGGLSLRAALIVIALVLGTVMAGLFYCFAYRLTRSQKAATLGTLLFFLNGGLGFIYFVRDWWLSNKSPVEFWNTLTINYANVSELGIHWTNLVADMMVPQRTSLFGLPLGLMIFTIFASFWQRCYLKPEAEARADDGQPRLLTMMIFGGVLAGLLPLFHTHTYIAVGLVSIVLFVFKPRREWLAFWLPAILIPAPQLLTLIGHASGSGVVRIFLGWLGHDEPFFPLYLLRNFGLPLVLAVPAWWSTPKEWRKFYLAFLLPFVVTFVVVFSPNLFDNGKLTYFWHAGNSVLVASWLVKLASEYRQRLLVVILAFFSMASALIVFHSEVVKASPVFSNEELAAAAFVRQETAAQALFLTAPALNPPISSLTGRPVVRGATRWLWSHGYEFRERENDVRRIYAGSPDAPALLRYYQVDYVYVGNAERSDLKVNAAFFDANFQVLYQSPTIKIYDVRKLRASVHEVDSQLPRELASRLEHDPASLLVEFPRTSFFVYRLFKATYGRMPRRAEFMTAMTLLGRGVFVGASGWEQSLEQNRNYLLDDWVRAAEFRRLYDGESDAEFVDTLLKNAGLNWIQSRREALVNRPGARPAALLSIAEDKEFYAREYNNAWVLAHFFGYLRRNPDDAPDYDLKGFNFWRDRLNLWKDYRTISLAFIESDEYRNMELAP